MDIMIDFYEPVEMKALVTLARGSSSQIGLLQLAFAQLMSAFQIKIPFTALIFVNFPLL